MQLSRMETAIERMHRRAALWHAARLACGTWGEFRAAWPSIQRAVDAQLAREFGA
ncbi:hypothetical protein SAMN05444398_1011053 [Roseovarius pacificus]|uniref:Uncharacterized protein n=1 Tax=Roseovarius pacificus TaxID=337701 RepID=A0A1M6YVW2_9RHOB|nr:hypothetical protein SAMN05444398_1011053 [Roseovarius pacificus]